MVSRIPASIGTSQCVPFREKYLSKYIGCARLLEAAYMKIARRFSYVSANEALIQADRRLSRHDLNLSWDDESLGRWCVRRADQVQRIVGTYGPERSEAIVRAILVKYGIPFPEPKMDLIGIEPALRRCSCERWWKRQARVLQGRECDEMARNWRLVHDKGQIYCSHHAVNLRRAQKGRNRRILNRMLATNEEGQQYTLAELSELSVSNPWVRRSELMVRMSGFEELAKEQGRVGEFYTITCPSKYHSTAKGGFPNDKFNGAAVREANGYMVALWGRVRAALGRRGIDIYGFRVAEPHSDGCPHWHLLVFVRPDHRHALRELLRAYALAEDSEEPGAQKNRFKAVAIDEKFGSATGYIAKYISKAIDGHGVDQDLFGNDAGAAAVRIEAWAATHGIRQFQQIGGPSVTVWRELRRLDSPEDGLIEQAREAADSSDWAAFCKLQGTGRCQSISLARWQEFCPATGEILCPVKNRYGEPAMLRVFGLMAEGVAVMTRFYRWTIERLTGAAEPNRSRPVPGFSLFAGFDFGGPPGPLLESCQ